MCMHVCVGRKERKYSEYFPILYFPVNNLSPVAKKDASAHPHVARHYSTSLKNGSLI